MDNPAWSSLAEVATGAATQPLLQCNTRHTEIRASTLWSDSLGLNSTPDTDTWWQWRCPGVLSICTELASDAQRSNSMEAYEVPGIRVCAWTSHRTEVHCLPRWNIWQIPVQQQTLHRAGLINNLKSSAGTKQDKCLSCTAKYLLHISVAEGLSCSSLSCINLLNKLCEQKAHTCCICSMAEVPATTLPGKMKQGLTPKPRLIEGSLFSCKKPKTTHKFTGGYGEMQNCNRYHFQSDHVYQRFGTKKGDLATKKMGIQSLQVPQLQNGEPGICSSLHEPIYSAYFGNHQCGSSVPVLTNRG